MDTRFEEAIHFLANTYPESYVFGNSLSSTPILSAAYDVYHSNIIDSIIVVNPRIAFVKDQKEDSALDIFFQIWNMPIWIAL